jgi:hypothetical protein
MVSSKTLRAQARRMKDQASRHDREARRLRTAASLIMKGASEMVSQNRKASVSVSRKRNTPPRGPSSNMTRCVYLYLDTLKPGTVFKFHEAVMAIRGLTKTFPVRRTKSRFDVRVNAVLSQAVHRGPLGGVSWRLEKVRRGVYKRVG